MDLPPPAEEIIVVAPRLPSALGDRVFSIVSIEETAIAGLPRVDETLRQVPGVSLFRRTSSLTANATTQGLTLRAIAPSGAGRALVTLDGVPLNDPFGGWVIWSQVQPESLGRAEVIRGAGAGPYGAGALTGTVALYSKDKAVPVEGDASLGSLGTWRAGGRADFGLGSVGVRLTGAAQSFDGFVPVRGPARGQADIRADFNSYSGAARIAARTGATNIAAELGHFHESRGAGLLGAESASRGTTGSFTLAHPPTLNASGYRLGLWGKHADLVNSAVAVTADRNTTQAANLQYATPALGFGFNAALRGLQSQSRGTRSWEIGIDGRFADGESRELFRNLGLGFTRGRVAGGRQSTVGAYAEGALTHQAWLFTAGLRVDRWASTHAERTERDLITGGITAAQHSPDRSGVTVTGRLGLRRDFAQGAFVRWAAYSSFRPPTLNELHRPFRVGNDITEANPALDPERLYGLELGAGVERQATRMSATLFANRLLDPIANVTIGIGPGAFPIAGFVPSGGTLRQRQNVGRIDAVGLEAEMAHEVSDVLAFDAAFSVTRARVDGHRAAPQLTDKRPAQSPLVSATAGFTLKPLARVSLTAGARFESARFEDDLNTRRLSAGVTANARLALAVTETVSLYLAAENIFDSRLETAETGDGVESFAAPRVVRVGLRVN